MTFTSVTKRYLLPGLLLTSALTAFSSPSYAQMIPGYTPQGNQGTPPTTSFPSAASLKPLKPAPTIQTPVLPDREGGYVKNPMPSSVAPPLASPPPSNKVVSVSGAHISDQVKDLIKTSDERIQKISLGDEKFPNQKVSITELERDLDYDHRLREMEYLQKLSEKGMKLFNTTYDGKREWVEDGASSAVTTKAAPRRNVSSEAGGGPTSSDALNNDSEKDRLQLDHERTIIEREKLADEKKKLEQARKDAAEKVERHKHNLAIAKERMKDSTPDPKVSMIYGVGRDISADIMVPYIGRVVGVKVGDTLDGDVPMKILSIGSNKVKAEDEKHKVHVLAMGEDVPKTRPSLSKFMPDDDE